MLFEECPRFVTIRDFKRPGRAAGFTQRGSQSPEIRGLISLGRDWRTTDAKGLIGLQMIVSGPTGDLVPGHRHILAAKYFDRPLKPRIRNGTRDWKIRMRTAQCEG